MLPLNFGFGVTAAGDERHYRSVNRFCLFIVAEKLDEGILVAAVGNDIEEERDEYGNEFVAFFGVGVNHTEALNTVI